MSIYNYYSIENVNTAIIPEDAKKLIARPDLKLASFGNARLHNDRYYCKEATCLCHLTRFYQLVKQAEYWLCFYFEGRSNNCECYFINLHPNPIKFYVRVIIKTNHMHGTIDGTYMKLKQSVDWGNLIVPDLDWLLELKQTDSSKRYEPTVLSEAVCKNFFTEDDREWIKKHVADDIPDDIVMPESSAYDETVVDTLVTGYVNNLMYGDRKELVNYGADRKYWFPFGWNNSNGLERIYLINLHPTANYFFGVYVTGTGFSPIVDCKIRQRVIPFVEDL